VRRRTWRRGFRALRSRTLWLLPKVPELLGYPEAALRDADRALKDARDFGEAAALMYALFPVGTIHLCCGNVEIAATFAQELLSLAEEKHASIWKVGAMTLRGCVLASTGKAAEAVQALSSAAASWRATGATVFVPLMLSHLTMAHLSLNNLHVASRCIGEAEVALKETKETLWEAEVNRIAGEVVRKSSKVDTIKAEEHFMRALAVARQQQAKSWELRAAMSLARLWRDQGKVQQARELLAPVYGW
jgi:predicted ATPase